MGTTKNVHVYVHPYAEAYEQVHSYSRDELARAGVLPQRPLMWFEVLAAPLTKASSPAGGYPEMTKTNLPMQAYSQTCMYSCATNTSSKMCNAKEAWHMAAARSTHMGVCAQAYHQRAFCERARAIKDVHKPQQELARAYVPSKHIAACKGAAGRHWHAPAELRPRHNATQADAPAGTMVPFP